MHPVLLRLGDFEVPSYGFCLAVGALLGSLLLVHLGRRQGHPPALLLDLCLSLAVGGFAGGKLQALLRGSSHSPERVGLGSQGALAGAALALMVLFRCKRLPWREGLDLVAAPALLGGAVARLGCFLAGCCYGLPCTLPWAVTYPAGHPAAGPCHPVQLYETGLLLGGLVLVLGLRRPFSGWSGWLALTIHAAVRLVVDGFREGPPPPQGLTLALLAVGLLGVMGALGRPRQARARARRE